MKPDLTLPPLGSSIVAVTRPCSLSSSVGEVVYAGSEGDAAHDREPVAIFTGEVLPLYAGDLDDETVRMLLNELVSEIGHTPEQEEVHVGYRDRTWTLKHSQ
jgi:hypothetical protein